MAMKVGLNSFQSKHPPFAQTTGSNKGPSLACRLGFRSPPLTLCVSRNKYPSNSKSFLDRRLPDQSQDFDYALGLHRNVPSSHRCVPGLPCLRSELLHPSTLGIQPDPPDWPGRSEIARISIEQRASRADIPLSIRMIKMKRRQIRTGLGLIDKAVESRDCSTSRAFLSSVLIVRELQTFAVRMMESGLADKELEETVEKVRGGVSASLVLLFSQVFSQTPNLMVYVMVLLANFSVLSMVGDSAVGAPAVASLSETISGDENRDDNRSFIQGEDLPAVSLVEEAGNMRDEAVDEETVRGFFVPVAAEVDGEEHVEHLRTDLSYQINLSRDPENPLLLCNYARFLVQISRNYDRAEEYFKRATQSEQQPDAEALSQYADFLYMVRKDMWGAEERYQQSIAVEPNNPFYASKYANFLWSTGGEETCFPLDRPDD